MDLWRGAEGGGVARQVLSEWADLATCRDSDALAKLLAQRVGEPFGLDEALVSDTSGWRTTCSSSPTSWALRPARSCASCRRPRRGARPGAALALSSSSPSPSLFLYAREQSGAAEACVPGGSEEA